MERRSGPASLGSWLAETLDATGRSRAGLARMIGRSREEVTRWATGREQVPRMHLIEIASQLAPDRLDFVLKLKDCEDSFDRVRREAKVFARASGSDAGSTVSTLMRAMDGAKQSVHVDEAAEALEWVRNYSAAGFALRTWSEFLQRPGKKALIDSGNIARHLQYPVNLLIGTLLEAESGRGDGVVRSAGLQELRRLVGGTPETEAVPLIRQHAVHLLARYGDEVDREVVSHLLASGIHSTDALSRKLGYCGLMMSPEAGREAADEFVYHLSRDDELADVDLAFDATHYGDLQLSRNNSLRRPGKNFRGMASNIAKHYENPRRYSTLSDADAFRMLKIIDVGGFRALGDDVPVMLAACLNSDLIPLDSGNFTRLLRRRLTVALSEWSPVDPSEERVSTSAREPVVGRRYDAFLAYRTGDRRAVLQIAEALRDLGTRCWLDIWELVPGQLVQDVIERSVEECGAVVVFLGGSGLGRWERLEYRRALSLFVEHGRPVIPVVLSGTELPPYAPGFLREFHAVFAGDGRSPVDAARRIATGLAVLSGEPDR